MILVIDNYDSFTYNLVHYLNELGAQTRVYRNDALTAEQALALKPQAVLLSPGGVFKDVPSPFAATRYHSLAIDRASLPNTLEVTAWTDDGEIMGVQHKDRPMYGVQFHPESIATQYGHEMLANFLDLAGVDRSSFAA
jgi:anthranilate synthase component 2